MTTQVISQVDESIDSIEEPEAGIGPAASSAPGTPVVRGGTPADMAAPRPSRPSGNRHRDSDEPKGWYDRIEAFISRLSVRDNFWRSVCALIWLPLAFFSGLKLKRVADDSFAFVLPFRRFNRNWYRAMAGGALLANSEIAGGAYVFGICGGDYIVVCKNLNYTFLRPCYGPAIYRIKSRENLHDSLAHNGEFNITLDLEITQQASRIGERDKRVGKCEATFHVTPKLQQKAKAERNGR